MKKILLPTICLFSAVLLSACGAKTDDSKSTDASQDQTTQSEAASDDKNLSEEELNKLDLPQLTTKVESDEDLVEIQTTDGNIQLKLFPKYAPLACENFVTHAKDGYYNNTVFHRVMKNFMIQGGDPLGTGAGGESIWKGKDSSKDSGNGFKNEISPNLYNIRGAISYANAGADTNGSQWFINTNSDDQSAGLAKQWTPEKIIDAYKLGGNPSLDGSYTVFGQVVKGMDIVEKIENQKVTKSDSGEESKPVTPVKVKTIKVLQEAK